MLVIHIFFISYAHSLQLYLANMKILHRSRDYRRMGVGNKSETRVWLNFAGGNFALAPLGRRSGLGLWSCYEYSSMPA